MFYCAINKEGQFYNGARRGIIWDSLEEAARLSEDYRFAWDRKILSLLESGEAKLVPDPRYRFVGLHCGMEVYENEYGERTTGSELFAHEYEEIPEEELLGSPNVL